MPLVLGLAFLAGPAAAQNFEPRAYANAPTGLNFLVVGTTYTQGGLAFDASVPITDEHVQTTGLVLAYARSMSLGGKSAKFDMVVPYMHLWGDAIYLGVPTTRNVSGFGRPSFRFTYNFHGAPALGLREFATWKQDLIIGASLQVSPPLGQYDENRIVNIASNRWSFKPELGISRAVGPWTGELKLAATFFTDNDEFFGGVTREQDPVYAVQGNLIRALKSGSWWSVDATYFSGGQSRVDDVVKRDLQQNWRVGLSWSLPIDRANSVKFAASSGVYARTGNSFDSVSVSWQHRWGAGL